GCPPDAAVPPCAEPHGPAWVAPVRRARPRSAVRRVPGRCDPPRGWSPRCAGGRIGRLTRPFARGVAGNTARLAQVLWDERPAVGEHFTYVTHCTRGVARRTG